MGFFDKIKKAFSAEKKEEEKQEILPLLNISEPPERTPTSNPASALK